MATRKKTKRASRPALPRHQRDATQMLSTVASALETVEEARAQNEKAGTQHKNTLSVQVIHVTRYGKVDAYLTAAYDALVHAQVQLEGLLEE